MPTPSLISPHGPVATQGTLPADELTALLAAVEAGCPWRQALRDLPLPTLSNKPDWFTNPSKAAFYLSLSDAGGGTAMDIGAGSGVIAAELTRRFDRVVALERDPRWCRFMEHRFREDDLPVNVIEGSALSIPNAVGTIDLAVVNGVMEWIATSKDSEVARQKPSDVQVQFLRGIHGRLRPRGQIGIAIENRYHYENFRGASPHGEPPYAALAPRVVANWMTRRDRGEPYRVWIHGARGYTRLLTQAGFRDIVVHAVLPTYHRPEIVLPLADARRIRARVQPKRGLKGRVLDGLAALGVLGHFVHSYYIAARRP